MNWKRLMLICYCLLGITLHAAAAGNIKDSTKSSRNYAFSARINYPMPLSGATFNRIYSGITSIGVVAQRVEWQKFLWGINFDYMLFQTSSKVLDVRSYMQLYAPTASAGLRCALKKFKFTPFINAGYAFILFTGVDTEGNAKPAFHQQGVLFKTGLCIGYSLNKRMELGLNGAWAPVLQHFGNKVSYESNIISIVDYGIYFTYRL